MKIAFLTAGLVLAASMGPAAAGEEPYGQAFDGWKFTQEGNTGNRVNCRAYFGTHLMAMRTDGNTYVSTSSNGLPAGKDEEANINVGGVDNLVQTTSGGRGGRLVFGTGVDRALMEQIVRARGYRWTTGLRGKTYSGTVVFNASTAKAYGRLRECVKANGRR